MTTRHIALVPESGMNPSDLARVSAGLQKQVSRDLAPIWAISATVDPFPSLEDVPVGYWPIMLTFRHLAGDAGIHIDGNGQPYALVEMSPSWSLTASHVCLEMLTDPFGGRTFPGASPRSDQGDVEFMGGICDPCEHPDYAYLVNDVLVSDFCTPAFWEPSAKGDRRSFTGALETCLQVLPGGHLSWYDPTTNSWWLRRHADGSVSDIKVGIADAKRGTVREFISGHVPHLESTKMTIEAFEARVGAQRQRAARASQSRAYWFRTSLDNLEREDALRVVLGAARAPREVSSRHQALSALLRMSMRSNGSDAALNAATLEARAPDPEPEPEFDPPTVVIDESILEREVFEAPAAQAARRVASEAPAPPPAHARSVPPPLPTPSATPASMAPVSIPPVSMPPLPLQSNAPGSGAPMTARLRPFVLGALAAMVLFFGVTALRSAQTAAPAAAAGPSEPVHLDPPRANAITTIPAEIAPTPAAAPVAAAPSIPVASASPSAAPPPARPVALPVRHPPPRALAPQDAVASAATPTAGPVPALAHPPTAPPSIDSLVDDRR